MGSLDCLTAVPVLHSLLAYGPVPGVELIPYFLGLLAWVGLALVSIFLAPISALLRRLCWWRRGGPDEANRDPMAAAEREADGQHDRA